MASIVGIVDKRAIARDWVFWANTSGSTILRTFPAFGRLAMTDGIRPLVSIQKRRPDLVEAREERLPYRTQGLFGGIGEMLAVRFFGG